MVKDAAKMEEYATRAAETRRVHGAEPLLCGGLAELLWGEAAPHGAGVVRFADMASLRAWFRSDAYQALSPLRDAACDMTLLAYDAPA